MVLCYLFISNIRNDRPINSLPRMNVTRMLRRFRIIMKFSQRMNSSSSSTFHSQKQRCATSVFYYETYLVVGNIPGNKYIRTPLEARLGYLIIQKQKILELQNNSRVKASFYSYLVARGDRLGGDA